MDGKVCLIGYRGLRHEKFFGLLSEAGSSLLLDVRTTPYSPNPDYTKAALREAAPVFGVRYFHVPAVGYPGAGNAAIPEGAPRTLEEQLLTPAARKILAGIVQRVTEGQAVTLMCSEPNYRDCHRVTLVEELLALKPDLALEELTARGEQRLF